MLKRTHYTSELKKNIGKEVVISGWCHDVRLIGGINFLLLRDKDGIVQVTAKKGKVPEKILEIYKSLHQEDVLSIKGKVVRNKIVKGGIEVIPSEIEVISKAQTPLPLDPRNVTPATLDTQLDWRFMFFRTEEAKAIFKIQSQIVNAFREFCLKNGYLEMQPPIIISSASEGGAELFEIPYFEKKAFLAQSPQLYKQMGAISFEKVFMVVPVFRAEKFDQPTHLNEIRQMDIEQAFINDEEAMDILEDCFFYILESVKKNCKEEFNFLNCQLKIPKKPLKRITYTETINLLQKAGEKIEWGKDFTKVQEKNLSKLLKAEAFFIKDWPTELKPFYAMPHENNPKLCKAYDLIHNGIEISSGTQRIHIPDLLVEQIKNKGLNPENFKYYVDIFRYGAPPHAGWSIGLERITMSITGKKNIREVTMFPRDRNRITP
ncbi:MAG: aspartate--tRNA(Asn) ligase [Candidatus Aenigmarchaeota archaeon]|nr:aspartate--tRNA(Asn) ligase [Candidatus Aenigmarchaeota archaeon]